MIDFALLIVSFINLSPRPRPTGCGPFAVMQTSQKVPFIERIFTTSNASDVLKVNSPHGTQLSSPLEIENGKPTLVIEAVDTEDVFGYSEPRAYIQQLAFLKILRI